MPSDGLRANVQNLTAETMNKFIKDHFTPERIYICGAGIEHHKEFEDLVEKKLKSLTWEWKKPI